MRRAHQLFVAGCCCCDSTPIYDGFCRHRDHEGRPSRAQFPTSLSRLDESSRRFLARRRPPRLTEAPSLGRGGTVRGTPAYARRVQRRRLARSQPPLAGLRRAFAALPAPKQTPRNTPLCGRRFLFSLLFSSSFSVSHLLLCAFPAAPPLARATGVCTDLETRTCVPAAFPLSPFFILSLGFLPHLVEPAAGGPCVLCSHCSHLPRFISPQEEPSKQRNTRRFSTT